MLSKITGWLNNQRDKSMARTRQRLKGTRDHVQGSVDGFKKAPEVENTGTAEEPKEKNAYQLKAESIRQRIADRKEKNAQKRLARKESMAEKKEKTQEKIAQIRANSKLPLTKASKRFNAIALFVLAMVSFVLVETKTWPASVLLEAPLNKSLPDQVVYLEIVFILLVVCIPLMLFLKRKMKIQDRERPPEKD